VQGLAELQPVSSSAHIVVAEGYLCSVLRRPNDTNVDLPVLNASPYTVLRPDDHLADIVAILARDREGLIDLFDLPGVCKHRCKPLGVCIEQL
jgi:undecaprenyl pyrophosphate phosphatase UppP